MPGPVDAVEVNRGLDVEAVDANRGRVGGVVDDSGPFCVDVDANRLAFAAVDANRGFDEAVDANKLLDVEAVDAKSGVDEVEALSGFDLVEAPKPWFAADAVDVESKRDARDIPSTDRLLEPNRLESLKDPPGVLWKEVSMAEGLVGRGCFFAFPSSQLISRASAFDGVPKDFTGPRTTSTSSMARSTEGSASMSSWIILRRPSSPPFDQPSLRGTEQKRRSSFMASTWRPTCTSRVHARSCRT